jgi:cellulose synthase/poly-beta-1,6-N-acetylglucosamine synthase-like glycosyltransferase
MEIFIYILLVFNLIIVFFLIFPFLTVVFSLPIQEREKNEPVAETDFACIITAYQNAAIAIPLIDSFLKQNYGNYHIYLVADDCNMANISVVDSRLSILLPEKKLGSKVKSFIYGMKGFVRNHEAVVILDPDNLGHPDFLKELNKYMKAGYKAVQGKRIAKNLDSVYACIDATGELYFNYTLKYVPYLLGSSANIAGSGMAIETSLFKAYLSNKRIADHLDKVIVAEDKIMQNVLVTHGVQIAFAKNALLYDEKVAKSDQVVRQRSRWLNSYFENIKYAGRLMVYGITSGNINRTLFGLLTIFPPMFLIVGSSLFLLLADALFSPALFFLLAGAGMVFLLNFILVLYLGNAPAAIWKNLYGIPAFVFFQVVALFRMKKANKDFLATTHTNYVTIDHVINKKELEK